jgi:sugar phosphate isomerase/epimerase
MKTPYRFAVCNELFQKISFDEACKKIREIGYDGVEIAPFTIAECPLDIDAAKRNEISKTLAGEGLSFVGLHWLMVSPSGLHVTTRDAALRKRSWDHIHQLIDLCGDIADGTADNGGVMIFGSPKQRSTVDGMSPKEATDVFTSGLANVAPHAQSRGVKILVEALPQSHSNVVTSLAEAVSVVKQIGSPAVKTMFDTHNAVNEIEAHCELVRKYFIYIDHVHVNEADGREPGTGDYDFAPILSVLSELDYSGFVSLEAFDFSRDPEEIAKLAIKHLKASQLAA